MHGLRWIGTARLFAQLVTWSLTIVTVRLLSPSDYGLVATSGLFTVLATFLMDGGLSVVLVSRRDLSPRMQGAAMMVVLLASLVLAGAIAAAAPFGAHLFNNEALTNVLRVAALQLPLAALSVVPTTLLSKGLQFKALALAQAGSSVLQGITMLALAWLGAGYWSLIIGTLVGSAARASMLWLGLKHRPSPNFDFATLGRVWRSGIQMVGQRLVYFSAQDFDTFMLGRLGGSAVLGSYSLAKTLSHSPLDQLAGIVNQVSLPAFAAKGGDDQGQYQALLLLISTVATLVFPLFWLGGALSQAALPLLFGDRWAPMIVPFMAFTFMLPFRSLFALLDSAVVGTGRVSTTFSNMVTWAVIMMPLLFLSSHFGANWTAASWCVGFPAVFIISMWRIARAFGVHLRELLRPIAAPLVASLTSALVVQLVIMQTRAHMPLIAQLLIGATIGLVCYGLLIRQFARPHFDRARGLAGRFLRI